MATATVFPADEPWRLVVLSEKLGIESMEVRRLGPADKHPVVETFSERVPSGVEFLNAVNSRVPPKLTTYLCR